MTGPLSSYEAPRGFTLDGFIDPVDLPSVIRVVTPPNAKSSHALSGAICRSLGADRDLYTKTNGEAEMLSSAAAWSLAAGVTDMYVAAAEDLTRNGIYDCIDFAGRIGANLHLVFSYGQAHVHGGTLTEVGFEFKPFHTLPEPLMNPHQSPPTPEETASGPLAEVSLPADHWPSFRAAYHATLPEDLVEECDRIYLDAYATVRNSIAATVDEIAALAGRLWEQHGVNEAERTLTIRALQAAMFRNGRLVRIELNHFTRHVQQRYVNLMTPNHYTALRGFVKPWRAAATVLHAYHVSTEDILALKALHVTADGHIPSLNISPPAEARLLLAAQRWRQLITEDANPPLFTKSSHGLRQGIRAVVQELDLPLIPYWRTLTNDKGRGNIGITVEAFA